jgi:hypothetical protein
MNTTYNYRRCNAGYGSDIQVKVTNEEIKAIYQL